MVVADKNEVQRWCVSIHNQTACAKYSTGWQRRPSDIIIAVSERNPRRPPDRVRYPNPAVVRLPNPASIMITGPAPRFVAHPIPASIRGSPRPITIRSPISMYASRVPASTVGPNIDPRSVWFEWSVEIVDSSHVNTDRDVRNRAIRRGRTEKQSEPQTAADDPLCFHR